MGDTALEARPRRSRLGRPQLLAAAAGIGLAAAALLTAGGEADRAGAQPTTTATATAAQAAPSGALAASTGTVFAPELANPRGMVAGADGAIYVLEAGSGGADMFTAPPPFGPSMRGPSGRLLRIAADGTKSTVASNLPSLSLGGREVVGPNGLVQAEGAFWVGTAQLFGGVERRQYEASVLRIDASNGNTTVVADIGAYEQTNNPEPFAVDSNLTGITLGPDRNLYVADAGGNTIYRVNPVGGGITPAAVIPGLPGLGPNPARGGANTIDPVPTSIVTGPDGYLYVGLLSGFPFTPGAARVLRVSTDGIVIDWVTGLLGVVGLAIGPDRNLYIVEYASSFDLAGTPPGWRPNSGRITRITPGRDRQVVVDGLNNPYGIAFDAAGNLYVTVNSNAPPMAGPQGRILRFDRVGAPFGR